MVQDRAAKSKLESDVLMIILHRLRCCYTNKYYQYSIFQNLRMLKIERGLLQDIYIYILYQR